MALLRMTTALQLVTWFMISYVLVSTQASSVYAGHSSTGKCRCLFTEPCWPSKDEFAALEATLSQPLLAPQQLATPCHTSWFLNEECELAQELWVDGWWRSNSSNSAGGTEQPTFAAYYAPDGHIEACFLNTTLGYPCLQGNIPPIGVDVRSVKDIQLAIDFAAAHNLRVVVKNTGHDYLGRSTARNAFLIWTHHLKSIQYHDTFKPSGAPNGTVYTDAITLGSGVQWQEAYDAVFARGRIIVGGIAPGASVGAAGGWVQGGGHSALAPQHGLGVDNVLEMTIVTSDGRYHVVNSYQEPDLFWALRGGGGGTWGVVVSVTYQTHPSSPILAAYMIASVNAPTVDAGTADIPTFRALFTELVRITPTLADAGWSGYVDILPSDDTGLPWLSLLYIAPASAPTARSTMQDFFAFAQHLADSARPEEGALYVDLASIDSLSGFAEWELTNFRGKSGEVGVNTELGSRLLPRDLLQSNHTAVADAVLGLGIPHIGFYIVAGGAVSTVDPDSVALNPAWRDALIHVVFSPLWEEGASLDTINAARDLVKKGEAAFRALTPGGGAYFNEASLYEENFQQTFWGSHYEKLRAVKKQYDPIDLFVVPEGVGSEDWDADLNCRL
ncbi:FAD-binding domain-containing protein [Phanerochaete sordida]|uniref:FAD-binding domain-containing protein n=1 Tax=Phanerochaete sordida TaxID=48140 RepID=A0A9P3LMG4_9APHY|nr:FAD-binding domain-containing protein [Phanerochaete sordida]